MCKFNIYNLKMLNAKMHYQIIYCNMTHIPKTQKLFKSIKKVVGKLLFTLECDVC